MNEYPEEIVNRIAKQILSLEGRDRKRNVLADLNMLDDDAKFALLPCYFKSIAHYDFVKVYETNSV